jgi:hypothetical protein
LKRIARPGDAADFPVPPADLNGFNMTSSPYRARDQWHVASPIAARPGGDRGGMSARLGFTTRIVDNAAGTGQPSDADDPRAA